MENFNEDFISLFIKNVYRVNLHFDKNKYIIDIDGFSYEKDINEMKVIEYNIDYIIDSIEDIYEKDITGRNREKIKSYLDIVNNIDKDYESFLIYDRFGVCKKFLGNSVYYIVIDSNLNNYKKTCNIEKTVL